MACDHRSFNTVYFNLHYTLVLCVAKYIKSVQNCDLNFHNFLHLLNQN